MARDINLLTLRNQKIRADYNRLKCQELIVANRGDKVVIRMTYGQILTCLRDTHHLSIRTLEGILSATEPKMAPITTGKDTRQAVAA